LLSISNRQKRKVDFTLLRKAASLTLKLEFVGRKQAGIVLVDSEEIKRLNKEFLGRDRATDVLAFPLGGEFISTKDMVGEVVISVEDAARQAEDLEHKLNEELALLVIHGLLHLAGYRDNDKEKRKQMQRKEEEILHKLGVSEII